MARFTNVAVVDYGGKTAVSNRVTGWIPAQPTGSKRVIPALYGEGTVLTYVIALRNMSGAPLTELTITDDLGRTEISGTEVTPLTYTGDVLFYINGQLQAAPAVQPGEGLVFTGITVPPVSSAVLVYRAQVNNFAPLEPDSTIENTAYVTGGWLQEPLEFTAEVTAASEPDLVVTKALDPVVVPENGQLTYTVVIENRGSVPAIPPRTHLTDTFDPILKDITVTYDGEPQTNYEYSEETGRYSSALMVPAAIFTREDDGTVTVTPGRRVVTVTGTV